MRISDWSSDVCSSDLEFHVVHCCNRVDSMTDYSALLKPDQGQAAHSLHLIDSKRFEDWLKTQPERCRAALSARSEEHTSELQSLMRISYAVFCLKKKKIMLTTINKPNDITTRTS